MSHETCATVKVVATNPDEQGPFVFINESDFDAAVHKLYGAADVVVEEKKLSVAELREALAAKGVEIPEGAKKAELQALYDAA